MCIDKKRKQMKGRGRKKWRFEKTKKGDKKAGNPLCNMIL